MSLASHAQTASSVPIINPLVPSGNAAPAANTPAPLLTGLAAMETITLKASGPATPLQHGNVIPGSEHLDLNGRLLTGGLDYVLDAAAGVVYLFVAQKAGDTLTVDYHYGDK